MPSARPEARLTVTQAEVMLPSLPSLTDEQVLQVYDAYASYISYLHADDYGGDWKKVPRYRPHLDAAKIELDRRGIEPPTGYLL